MSTNKETSRIGPEADDSFVEIPLYSAEVFRSDLESMGLWTEKVELAFDQATTSHLFKKRDSGRPYLDEHIFPVAHDVLDYLRSKDSPIREQEKGVVVALLHDTVEDDEDFDLADCEAVFGLEISRLIYPLTKFGIDREIYIRKIENAPELDQIIKTFDRINNLRCSIALAQTSVANPDVINKLERYTYETARSYLSIAGLVLDQELYDTLKNLIDQARAVLIEKGDIS
jgi:(p)ppGpp synthase/HD superfamily hydrolase